MRNILFVFATFVFTLTSGAFAQGPHIIEAAPRIMVLPFSATGDAGTYSWVGTGIQQSLLTEVNRPGSIAWSVSSTVPSTQPSQAVDATATAQRAGATVVVSGNYQIAGDDVRVTGQMVDVASGRVMVALKATGALHDLFKVEDQLDSQLQAGLPQPMQQNAVSQNQPANDSSVEELSSGPVAQPLYYESAAPTIAYPQTYGLPYPYYSSYAPGYFPGGFVFYGNFNRGFFGNGFFGSRFGHHGLVGPVHSHTGFGVGFGGPGGGFGGHGGFMGGHGGFGGGHR